MTDRVTSRGTRQTGVTSLRPKSIGAPVRPNIGAAQAPGNAKSPSGSERSKTVASASTKPASGSKTTGQVRYHAAEKRRGGRKPSEAPVFAGPPPGADSDAPREAETSPLPLTEEETDQLAETLEGGEAPEGLESEAALEEKTTEQTSPDGGAGAGDGHAG